MNMHSGCSPVHLVHMVHEGGIGGTIRPHQETSSRSVVCILPKECLSGGEDKGGAGHNGANCPDTEHCHAQRQGTDLASGAGYCQVSVNNRLILSYRSKTFDTSSTCVILPFKSNCQHGGYGSCDGKMRYKSRYLTKHQSKYPVSKGSNLTLRGNLLIWKIISLLTFESCKCN